MLTLANNKAVHWNYAGRVPTASTSPRAGSRIVALWSLWLSEKSKLKKISKIVIVNIGLTLSEFRGKSRK